MKENQIELTTDTQIPIPAKVICSIKNDQAPLILLLHGYQQSAKSFSFFLGEHLEDYSWVCLQGPFPAPYKVGQRSSIGFGWYFYELDRKLFHIPISTATHFAITALQQLQLFSRVERIIGYSQGGYLAPYLALKMPLVRQVIGVGCRFRHEDLNPHEIKFQLDAIHGAKDQIVDPLTSQESFQNLKKAGVSGNYVLLPEVAHELVEEMCLGVKKILSDFP